MRVSDRLLQAAGDDPEAQINLLASNLNEHARLLGEARNANAQLRAACVLALEAFRAQQAVETHTMEAAQYETCKDCCSGQPCAEFGRLHTRALDAMTVAMAALRGITR